MIRRRVLIFERPTIEAVPADTPSTSQEAADLGLQLDEHGASGNDFLPPFVTDESALMRWKECLRIAAVLDDTPAGQWMASRALFFSDIPSSQEEGSTAARPPESVRDPPDRSPGSGT